MSAAALQSVLAAMHIAGEIQSHGTVAVLVTPSPEELADADVRAAILQAAGQHGFRTLGVELSGVASNPDSRIPLSEVADLHRP